MTALDILLRSQDRKIETCHFDLKHFVAGDKAQLIQRRRCKPKPTGAWTDLSHGCNIRFNR
jgi:hypothetical protein